MNRNRTKFNVDKDAEKRTHHGIVFDSQMEMKYYRDVLCPQVESGEVVYYELQKKYELQPGFMRNGKKVMPIIYVADFYVEYADGRTEVIDIKGCPDSVSKIKRKLFWRRYPEINYIWLTLVHKFGGWISYDECKKLRKEEKEKANGKEGKENFDQCAGEDCEGGVSCIDNAAVVWR